MAEDVVGGVCAWPDEITGFLSFEHGSIVDAIDR